MLQQLRLLLESSLCGRLHVSHVSRMFLLELQQPGGRVQSVFGAIFELSNCCGVNLGQMRMS